MGVYGSHSVATLVSLLLPHSWWHLKFIFYVILVVVEMDPVLKNIGPYKQYLGRLKSSPRLLPERPRHIRMMIPAKQTNFIIIILCQIEIPHKYYVRPTFPFISDSHSNGAIVCMEDGTRLFFYQ